MDATNRNKGMPSWFWVCLAAVQTVLAVMLWVQVEEWLVLERSYAPEILAAAHFTLPPNLWSNAIVSGVIALGLWVRAYFSIDPEA